MTCTGVTQRLRKRGTLNKICAMADLRVGADECFGGDFILHHFRVEEHEGHLDVPLMFGALRGALRGTVMETERRSQNEQLHDEDGLR